jgi:hypothetical protein
MEKHLGRKLKKGEQVHHINKNTSDNRIENLLLTNIKEHNVTYHPKKLLLLPELQGNYPLILPSST